MKKILQKLLENEKALADLYKTYADKFPSHKKFWIDLSNEEMGHCHAIEQLSSGNFQDVRINEKIFDRNLLKISADYIEEKQRQAMNEKILYKDALKTALEFETSIIEKGYFEIFEGDSPEFWRTINKLVFETKVHSDKIRKEIAKKSWSIF